MSSTLEISHENGGGTHDHTMLRELDQRKTRCLLGLVRAPIEHVKKGGEHSELEHRLP